MASIAAVKTSLATDILAVVRDIGEKRHPLNQPTVVDVTLADGSGIDQRQAEIKIAVWGDTNIDFIEAHRDTALMFLNVAVTKVSAGLKVNFFKGEMVCKGAEEALAQSKEAITEATEVEKLTTDFVPTAKIETSGPQVMTCAAILNATAEATELDMPEVMQVNFLQVEEPTTGQEVWEKTHTRIWFASTVRDFSGAVSLYVSEKAALQLSGLTSAEEFARVHATDALVFPFYCSARVTRQVQAVGQKRVVRLVVAEAEPAVWEMDRAPNAASNRLLEVLKHCSDSQDGILVANMSELRHCPHYGIKVQYSPEIVRNAKYVVALMASTTKSRLEKAAHGFMVTTEKVRDAAEEGWEEAYEYVDVVGHCALDNVLNFKLDPARGVAQRYALGLINAVSDNPITMTLEGVHPVDTSELAQVRTVLGKLRRLAMQTKCDNDQTNKRDQTEFDTPPASVKRARAMNRQPTDDSLC